MRFGISLRGDLAKLDDAEIASRYEALIAERVAMDQGNTYLGSNWFYRLFWGLFHRGPFRARIFYKIQALVLCFVQVLSLHFDFTHVSSFYDVYLSDCELKDVRDEIRRRVQRRAKARSVAGVTP